MSIESLLRIVEVDGDVVELAATTPAGDLVVIARMIKEGHDLVLWELHIDGSGAGSLGIRRLRRLAVDFGKSQGAKRVVVHGAVRTSGANPGHVPRPICSW